MRQVYARTVETIAARSEATRVILVGMMGSGKSSVGGALAARTGWPYVDNDELVDRATGRSAKELLAAGGEAALRSAEADALVAALDIPPPVVVAVAGGTILDGALRQRLLGGGFVAWLRAPAEVLAERATGGSHRPWLDGDPLAWFLSTSEKRDPLYASVADVEVDTSAAEPGVVADRILAALGRR
jgi:shikimate kinase